MEFLFIPGVGLHFCLISCALCYIRQKYTFETLLTEVCFVKMTVLSSMYFRTDKKRKQTKKNIANLQHTPGEMLSLDCFLF